MATFHHLAAGITCHAWNKDKTLLALCPNTNEIWIYNSKTWKCEHVLSEHDMVVSGLDWSPIHNKIVSCSHDRNAFVWTLKNSKWEPDLVLLRITRAAINVKWSPDGKKFAVASGAKCVPVCYYEAANNWWISKMVKKHKSTVVDIDWHPNSQLLVTGSSDMKCRIFSAYVKELDTTPHAGPFKEMSPFGELMAEFGNAKGWVESVAWSPSGERLAFVGHDSSIHFVHFGQPGETPTIQTLNFQFTPLQRILFLSNDAVVGGGHECNAMLFTTDQNGYWTYSEMLDKKGSGDTSSKSSSGFSAAKSMWESKVDRGQSSGATSSDKGTLWTKHQSTITYLFPYEKSSNGNVTGFTSSALDGRIVFWDLNKLDINMSKLKM